MQESSGAALHAQTSFPDTRYALHRTRFPYKKTILASSKISFSDDSRDVAECKISNAQDLHFWGLHSRHRSAPALPLSTQKFVKSLLPKSPWPQLNVPVSRLNILDSNYILEEEHHEEFQKGLYYPLRIGDVLVSRYQVVGKLGFGATSTAWLGAIGRKKTPR
jgi:hypothetical protein